jgi:hypothetical protein
MIPDDQKLCPLLKEPCLQHKCQWFIRFWKPDALKGTSIEEYNCAIVWLPLLVIEGTDQQKLTTRAVEALHEDHSSIPNNGLRS